MPAATRPKLPQLKTPMTATFPISTFPSELSAVSARSPFPGFSDFIKQEESMKTPITPPVAYLDFLKTMSPLPMSPLAAVDDTKSSGQTTPTSAPSTGTSEHSDCSCNCEHKSTSPITSPTTTSAPSSFTYPSSAPTTARLGRLRIPQSPANSTADSPLSASTTLRSPFSARSARSPFDWDFSSRGGRYWDTKSPKTRSSVRLVRETVTRTVTYTSTPQMAPAPKGKRRKME